MNIASNILSINKIITLKNKKMNKDYSFLNPESGIVPETRDFTPDYAPAPPTPDKE